MREPLLVIDCHYMCHRAFWSQRDLSWRGVATGVIYGFLKSLSGLKIQFQTDQIAFCFDSGVSLRQRIFPGYKQKREEAKLQPQLLQARSELVRQIDALRTSYLPEMGFRNIFHAAGYESDDIMAVLAQGRDQNVILITSDADLFQCLRGGRVSVYSPHQKKLFTEDWFRSKYGIRPHQWAVVKALAGCSSDGVPGIGRVGEATALKMITTRPRQLSTEEKEIVARNRRLVELPFSGTPVPKIQRDQVSRSGWDKVCSSLGMKSLVGRAPIYAPQPTLL